MTALGPDTIEARASRIAHDPDALRDHLAVHAAVIALVDAPSLETSWSDGIAEHMEWSV